jgi:hypothetical protein
MKPSKKGGSTMNRQRWAIWRLQDAAVRLYVLAASGEQHPHDEQASEEKKHDGCDDDEGVSQCVRDLRRSSDTRGHVTNHSLNTAAGLH